MLGLILGLALFLGIHSLRLFAPTWRAAQIAKMCEMPWKGVYTVASFIGLGLIIWGFGQTRLDPQVLWQSPRWTRHITALLMLASMVLLVAAYVPRNLIKARLGHPMLLGTKTWAFAHLLSNGRLADVLLFGGFLTWAVLMFISCRRADRAAGVRAPGSVAGRTALTVGLGVVVYGLFAFVLHAWLFGIRPF